MSLRKQEQQAALLGSQPVGRPAGEDGGDVAASEGLMGSILREVLLDSTSADDLAEAEAQAAKEAAEAAKVAAAKDGSVKAAKPLRVAKVAKDARPAGSSIEAEAEAVEAVEAAPGAAMPPTPAPDGPAASEASTLGADRAADKTDGGALLAKVTARVSDQAPMYLEQEWTLKQVAPLTHGPVHRRPSWDHTASARGAHAPRPTPPAGAGRCRHVLRGGLSCTRLQARYQGDHPSP